MICLRETDPGIVIGIIAFSHLQNCYSTLYVGAMQLGMLTKSISLCSVLSRIFESILFASKGQLTLGKLKKNLQHGLPANG